MTAALVVGALEVSDLRLNGRTGRPPRGGWAAVSGVDALLQAILVRLATPEGSLADLGHPAYGSRLHRLVGEPDVPATRQRARLYVTRALRQDPRIATVLGVEAAGDGRHSAALSLDVRLLPRGSDVPLAFRLPLDLEGTP